MFLNPVCDNFVENLCVYVHQENWSVVFFFLVVSLSGFSIRVMLASEDGLGVFLFFLFY